MNSIQYFLLLCAIGTRSSLFLKRQKNFKMWRWNFEDIFKLMIKEKYPKDKTIIETILYANEEETINEWVLATTFCSVLFVVASAIYLPHNFEPLKKIRYVSSINLVICFLANCKPIIFSYRIL